MCEYVIHNSILFYWLFYHSLCWSEPSKTRKEMSYDKMLIRSFHLCRTLWSLRMRSFKRKKYNHKYCFHSQGQPISTATKTYTGEPLRSSLVTEEFPMSYWPAVKYFLLVRMLLEGFFRKVSFGKLLYPWIFSSYCRLRWAFGNRYYLILIFFLIFEWWLTKRRALYDLSSPIVVLFSQDVIENYASKSFRTRRWLYNLRPP